MTPHGRPAHPARRPHKLLTTAHPLTTSNAGYTTNKSTRILHSPEHNTRAFINHSYTQYAAHNPAATAALLRPRFHHNPAKHPAIPSANHGYSIITASSITPHPFRANHTDRHPGAILESPSQNLDPSHARTHSNPASPSASRISPSLQHTSSTRSVCRCHNFPSFTNHSTSLQARSFAASDPFRITSTTPGFSNHTVCVQ